MKYLDLLKKRRAIREYEDRSVPQETIEAILKESCLAPNSGNRQEWRFIIVNNREMIKRISDESKGNKLKEIENNPAIYMSKYKDALMDKEFNVFYNAPTLILIFSPKDNPTQWVDGALFASYFMFAATVRGLGTCWIGLGNNIKDPAIKKELGITEELQLVAPVIVGYPKEIPPIPERNEPQILKVIT